MAKQISISEAKRSLRFRATQNKSALRDISLKEAKHNLLELEYELELPPIAPLIDKGLYKEVLLVSFTWAQSAKGIQLIYPLVKRLILSKVFK